MAVRYLNFLLIASNVFVATVYAGESYVPDISLTAPKIIKHHGYPSETHIVNTKDGYLLEIHRIPHGKNVKRTRRFPVLLQHGIVASSADWIINGPSKALAYLLADRGFDVWLGNSRGNTYSRSHSNLDTDNEEFWNFSFHEMGIYDTPAIVDYILEHTDSEQIYYVGHSMGTCIFFVMCSMLPEYNYKIRAQISLAPVAYVHHMTSILNSLVPYASQIQKASNMVSKGAFLPHNSASELIRKYLCGDNAINTVLCKKYIVYKMFGEDHVQFDTTLLPVILAHNPAGTSVKTLMHFAQEITSKNFQQFDYGAEENIRIYNCSHPPKYNLSNIIAPIEFYYAKNDILADPKNVIDLYTRLRNRLGLNLIEFEEFNHIDFLYSRDVFDMVYKNVINTLLTAELKDWIPVYDKTTSFNSLSYYNQCNDIEISDRGPRKNNDGLWNKITRYIRKKEVYPLIKTSEENVNSKKTFSNAWKEIFNL